MLTVDNVLKAMYEIVQERPSNYWYGDRVREITGEYVTVNPLCYYEINGQPACLVGMVFDRLGVMDEMLGTDPDRGDAPGVEELCMPKDVRNVLKIAQELQDQGQTWHAAYQAAHDN